jgi:hypothetical protein
VKNVTCPFSKLAELLDFMNYNVKNLYHNVLYRDHILLIVYSYILVRSILFQAIISTRTIWESKIDSEQGDGNG